jgi:hypothetical protein
MYCIRASSPPPAYTSVEIIARLVEMAKEVAEDAGRMVRHVEW